MTAPFVHASKCNCLEVERYPARRLNGLVLLQSLGADEVVNYREQDFAEVYKDPSKHFDAVIDCLGGEPCFTLLSYHVFYASAPISCGYDPAQVMLKSRRTR